MAILEKMFKGCTEPPDPPLPLTAEVKRKREKAARVSEVARGVRYARTVLVARGGLYLVAVKNKYRLFVLAYFQLFGKFWGFSISSRSLSRRVLLRLILDVRGCCEGRGYLPLGASGPCCI